MARSQSISPQPAMLSQEQARLAYFRWDHECSPYEIELSLEMVARFLAEISAAERIGKEIGGVLIGSFPKSKKLTLRIDDYLVIAPVDADQSRYDLSAEQRARLSATRRELLEQGTAVLGFFRSHRRGGGLALSEEEHAFLKLEFRRAVHTALLISAAWPHTAGFFVPDAKGVVEAGPSLLEFPFDIEQLAPLITAAPISAVPINSEPEPALSAGAEQNASLRQPWFWVAAALVALVCLSLTAWAPASMRVFGGAQALDLSVTKRSQVLELRWNQRQADLARASFATLTVTDGQSTRQWTLSRSEIRFGSICYQPIGSEVRFTLTLHLPRFMDLTQSVTLSRR